MIKLHVFFHLIIFAALPPVYQCFSLYYLNQARIFKSVESFIRVSVESFQSVRVFKSFLCQSIINYSRTPVCIGMTSYNFRPPVLTLNLNQIFLWRQYLTSTATLESQAFSTILCVMSPWDLVGKPLAEVPPLPLRNFPCAPYRPVSNSLGLPSFGHFFWVQRK